jgi:Fe-coproporphyrin III synthase
MNQSACDLTHNAMEAPVSSAQRGGYRVIQIHPTLKCNLTCLHCYSGSAPHLKEELELSALQRFLVEAADAGYNAISLSGGEPLLYSGILPLLEQAKDLGFYVSLTSNGTLFKAGSKYNEALRYLDLLAISLDGEPEHHNYMRNSPKAFERLEAGLEIVKNEAQAFGLIHTVTTQTFGSLLWMGEFAAYHKAQLLQLHPLENIGRGKEYFNALANDQDNLHRVYLLANYLRQKYEGEMLVEVDLLHRDHVLAAPHIVYAQRQSCGSAQLTNHLKELILDEKGNLLPVSHGFSRFFEIGNLYNSPSFAEQSARFIDENSAALQALFDQTFTDIAQNEELELINWAELVVRNSHFSGIN